MDRIDALRLFVRLAERGSFSAAAKELKVKQSTASKWIAELEAEWGVGLVERTTRSLHLTDAGRRLLSHAQLVLGAFDDMARELRDKSPEPSGCVRLSVPVAFGRMFVVPAVAEFLLAHPKVEAELVLDDRYVDLVERGFDLAVRVGVPTDTSARARKLADGRRCLVASPAYVAAHGEPKAPGDLATHQCLVHGEMGAAPLWRFGPARGAEIPVTVRGRVAANSSEAVHGLACAGMGIALLAEWLVAEDLACGRLVSLLPAYSAPPAPIFVLTPPGRFMPSVVRALSEHLTTSIAASIGARS